MKRKMTDKLKQLNRQLQKVLTKERFIKRVEELVKEGVVEVVDCEDDGTPIVDITDRGLEEFLKVFADA
jgi:hypothetical protein